MYFMVGQKPPAAAQWDTTVTNISAHMRTQITNSVAGTTSQPNAPGLNVWTHSFLTTSISLALTTTTPTTTTTSSSLSFLSLRLSTPHHIYTANMTDVQDAAPQEELALPTTTTPTDVAEPEPQAATAAAAAGKKVKKIIRRKKRPARPQIDPALIKSEPPPQTGTIFNIWYNKWSGGDREDKYLSQTAAKGRCNIARDSGYTKADRVAGSYFCLFFARGICTCFYRWAPKDNSRARQLTLFPFLCQ